MTTFAYHYDDQEVAFDSRCSCGSTIISDSENKSVKRDGVIFIGVGSVPNINKLIDSYFNGGELKYLDATVYAIDKGILYRCGQCNNDGFWFNQCTSNRAEGSGGDFAFGAMDHGKSAKDAVKYAATRDIYTGGKIRVLKVK